jgi:hypothetical protein
LLDLGGGTGQGTSLPNPLALHFVLGADTLQLHFAFTPEPLQFHFMCSVLSS